MKNGAEIIAGRMRSKTIFFHLYLLILLREREKKKNSISGKSSINLERITNGSIIMIERKTRKKGMRSINHDAI